MLGRLIFRNFYCCNRPFSQAASPTSLTNSPSTSSFQRPIYFEADGKKLKTDENWNLSPAVINLMKRQLLKEPSNPLSLLQKRIVNYFHTQYRKPGNRTPLFTVCDSEPRIVTNFENFDSLLTPLDHVSRRPSDTYYVNSSHCLRAHTSAHQYNLVREGLNAFLVFGDVYRRDEIDRTHYPCFHQLEGVRLYSKDELYNSIPGQDLAILEASKERTSESQEKITIDATKALEIQLKSTLEGLSDILFGKNCEKRWVDAYFPFTHPSFELEVFYNGKWLEVLGCGIMEQKLVESAGVTEKVGWAFGLGLERLAMVLYGIPDIRLFWSKDSGFLSQFANKSFDENFKYKEISVHPQVYFDISFFLPENVEFNSMTANVYDLIRSIGGDLVEQVSLTDEFVNKKKGLKSQTYRIVYRSYEKALTKDEVNIIHKEIEQQLSLQYSVKLR